MRAARAWHLLTALVALTALTLQLVLVIQGGRVLDETADPPSLTLRLLRFLSYFTIQSNILVLITTAVLGWDPWRRGGVFQVLRTAATTGIIVTAVVHWFELRPQLDLHGADLVADRLLHLAVPILAVVGWLVFGPRPAMTWATSLWASAGAMVWLAETLMLAAATGWYPYSFLDHREHGWDHVVGVSAGVLVLWFALVAGEHAYDRWTRPAPRAEAAVTGS